MADKVILIITVGLTGTGKTTIAKALAERLGLDYISSDLTRKKLAGIPETEHRYEGFDDGIYSPAFTRSVYSSMFVEAVTRMQVGKSLVLDASFIKASWRRAIRELVDARGVGFLAVECRLDHRLVRRRLSDRVDTPSDGTWATYLEQAKVFEPVRELPPEEHIVVDTSRPLEKVVGEIVGKIGGEGKWQKNV